MNETARNVVVAVVAVAVAIGTVVVLASADASPTGLQVNHDEISRHTLNSELDGFADGAFFADQASQAGSEFKSTAGALGATSGARWFAYRIWAALAGQVLDRRGESVTRSDLRAARKTLDSQHVIAGMGNDARDQLIRFEAAVDRLAKVTGSQTAAATAVLNAARKAHVELDPRYGTWDAKRLGVCPTIGCQGIVPLIPSGQ
jgi:hypothetical protein